MKTLADVNIYELYYIAMYHPIYNIDSCPDDFPTFSLPEVLPEYELHLLREETFDVEHIYPNIVQIQSKEYWKSPKDHYLALNFNRDKFIKSVSMILWKNSGIPKNGYIVFDCKQSDDNTYGCVLHQI